jgi:hypothetical protein
MSITRVKPSVLIATVIMGVIGGTASALSWPPYVYRATSGYSHQSFWLAFSEDPEEETFLDAIIARDPLIKDKATASQNWRGSQAEHQRLLIKVDQTHSILLRPYSSTEDPDIVFPEGGRVTGVWLTEPKTRTHIPLIVVRVVYFTAGFIAAAVATLLICWIWYFLLARIRELSHAVRGH